MPFFKYNKVFSHHESRDFDAVHKPGTHAPYAGIYRCNKCGHEIGIAEDHKLPPEGHPQHPTKLGHIKWQLVAAAIHNKQ